MAERIMIHDPEIIAFIHAEQERRQDTTPSRTCLKLLLERKNQIESRMLNGTVAGESAVIANGI